jgi:transketolase
LGGGNGCDSQDIALMRSVPNMVIVVPGDAAEARQAILAVSAENGPAYIRLADLPPAAEGAGIHEFQLGQAVTLREGTDIVMVCTGRQTAQAVHAATILETVGISARIIHVSTIQPLDRAAIMDAARGVRLVVTAEEHGIRGGLGEAIAEALTPGDSPPLLRLGFPPCSGSMVIREGGPEAEELSASRMAEHIHGWLRRGQ